VILKACWLKVCWLLMAAQAAIVAKDVYALPGEGLRGVPKEVILYQYDVCPFCCKVKAVLDYYRVRVIPGRLPVPCALTNARLHLSCIVRFQAPANMARFALRHSGLMSFTHGCRYPTAAWRWVR